MDGNDINIQKNEFSRDQSALLMMDQHSDHKNHESAIGEPGMSYTASQPALSSTEHQTPLVSVRFFIFLRLFNDIDYRKQASQLLKII